MRQLRPARGGGEIMEEKGPERKEGRKDGRKEGRKEGRKGVCMHAVVFVTAK